MDVTEAELIETFQNYLSLLDAQLLGFISVLSGFIVVSYLVADKLTPFLTGIVITIYTLACGVLITRMLLLRRDFIELHTYIVEQQAAGKIGMPWFGTNPPFVSEILNYLMIGVTVGGFFGSVLFFFFQRRAARHDV